MKFTVLLVSYGGPQNLDEIPAFLQKMMRKEIPYQILNAVQSRYRAIGGGSPLVEIMNNLADILSIKLSPNVVVKPAFMYSSPFIEEQIDNCVSSDTDAIIFFIMTPFYTSRTVGTYIDLVQKYTNQMVYKPMMHFIHSWYDEPLFISAWVNKLKEELPTSEYFLLFTAHSLPITLSSEPYKTQIENVVAQVTSKLGIMSNYRLAWQSIPEGTMESWIKPSVEQVIDQLSKETSHIIEVPIGFINDHLETLYDIDIVHRNYAVQRGFTFSRISSLNIDSTFVKALSLLIQTGISNISTQTISVAKVHK
jgi:protoporphyrin/coproporphyrin ferrochelatase